MDQPVTVGPPATSYRGGPRRAPVKLGLELEIERGNKGEGTLSPRECSGVESGLGTTRGGRTAVVNVGDPRKKTMEIRRCRARGLLSFGRDDQLDEAE